MKVTNTIRLEDARLIFKNFQGKRNDFNDEGNRTFGVLIPDELVDDLVADGWKIKYLKPKQDDPDEYRQPWLSVRVKFEMYPPIVVLINSRGKVRLDEKNIDQLDWSSIKTCDVIIRPYNYPALKGRPAGVSAYLKALYVTINEDEFELKYADLPYLNEGGSNEQYDEE